MGAERSNLKHCQVRLAWTCIKRVLFNLRTHMQPLWHPLAGTFQKCCIACNHGSARGGSRQLQLHPTGRRGRREGKTQSLGRAPNPLHLSSREDWTWKAWLGGESGSWQLGDDKAGSNSRRPSPGLAWLQQQRNSNSDKISVHKLQKVKHFKIVACFKTDSFTTLEKAYTCVYLAIWNASLVTSVCTPC